MEWSLEHVSAEGLGGPAVDDVERVLAVSLKRTLTVGQLGENDKCQNPPKG